MVRIARRPAPRSSCSTSITNRNVRPGSGPPLVVGLGNDADGSPNGDACARDRAAETYSAETIRRGRLSAMTEKSVAVRPVIGLPSLSTTATSAVTRSTPARNTGGVCCQGTASVSEAASRLTEVRMGGS